jgi:CheY-like chemotaxis protein
MHALIIEDEPFLAMVIEDHLRGIGYTSFDFAMTEAEAVAAAQARCPDLITSDVQLLQGCGIAAVEAICRAKRIPVVFITATAQAVKARMSDAIVVRKPIIVAELRQAVAATAP